MGNESLQAGQSLILPNKVHNSHNNSDVYRVYDPNEAIGNTMPTAKKPPKQKGCGVLGQILSVIVAAAASYFLGQVGGNLVSQGFNNVIGVQSGFSFKSLAMAYVTAGVTQGLSGAFDGIRSAFVQAAVTNVASAALTQGIGVVTGLQGRFDWAGVAAAGIGGGVASQIRGSGFGAALVRNSAYGLSSAGARALITGTSFGDNVLAVLPNVIGNTIGGLAADAVSRPRLSYANVGGDDGLAGGTQNNPSVADGAAATGGNSAGIAALANADQTQRAAQAAFDEGETIVVTANRETRYILPKLNDYQYGMYRQQYGDRSYAEGAKWAWSLQQPVAATFPKCWGSNVV